MLLFDPMTEKMTICTDKKCAECGKIPMPGAVHCKGCHISVFCLSNDHICNRQRNGFNNHLDQLCKGLK